MKAARDKLGIVHRVRGEPFPFMTQKSGGMPGVTACDVQFYRGDLGSSSCSIPWATPMRPADAPVDCMACIAAECQA